MKLTIADVDRLVRDARIDYLGAAEFKAVAATPFQDSGRGGTPWTARVALRTELMRVNGLHA